MKLTVNFHEVEKLYSLRYELQRECSEHPAPVLLDVYRVVDNLLATAVVTK